VAPAGTPPAIVAKLNDAIVTALNGADVAEQIRKVGAEPMPMSAAQFAGFIRSEITKWAKVVAESGAKGQ
jgi:tripartite-type tricarboxylate transporter receptor subunit TctC